MRALSKRKKITNLILVGMFRKIFVKRLPRYYICKPGAKLRVLLVAGDLPPFEPETGINAETLVIEISGEA